MTRLLVSVRNAVEARRAVQGGAQWIDVKEPRRGSLGAADLHRWAEIRAAVPVSVPTSVALGELAEAEVARRAQSAHGFCMAKVGLAGCARWPDWKQRWRNLTCHLPVGVSPVAVVYADWNSAQAPNPDEVVHAGIDLGCRALLIDTFDKEAGNVFQNLSPPVIERCLGAARAHGWLVVLAGGLAGPLIKQAADLQPDYLAVRGAVCWPNRRGQLRIRLVRQIATQLRNTITHVDAPLC